MVRRVTIQLEEALLRRAEAEAARSDRSVSDWLTEVLARVLADDSDYAEARGRALKDMQIGFHLGGRPLTRDETHAR